MDVQFTKGGMIYCRLCLKENVEAQDIISSKSKCAELTLIESLYWVFGVEVDVHDAYSKLICVRCENVVQYVGSYRALYQRNQLHLEKKLGFQFDDEPFEQQTSDEQRYSTSSTEPKRKGKFIEYYYRFPTTALQELKMGKRARIDNSKPKESSIESLVRVNGMVNVEVCKYCSEIFTRKHHLAHHYKKMHKLVNAQADKRLKLKVIGRQSVKRCNKSRRKFKNRKKLMQSYGHTNTNRLVIKKKKILFDTENFPNLNFMKQLEKYSKEASVNNTNQQSNDEINEKTSKDVSVFVNECIGVSEVRSYDNSISTGSECSDEQIKTIRINDDYPTLSEKSTRKLINDQLPTEHQNETEKNCNNKSKEKEIKTICDLSSIENGEKVMEIENDLTSALLNLTKIKAIKERVIASNQIFKKISFAHCDNNYTQIDKPLEVEEINLKEKYKHLNLKECYVSVKKCAVPEGYYKQDNVLKENRTECQSELLNKQEVVIDVEDEDFDKVIQWKKGVLTAFLRTQNIGSTSSISSSNKQNHGTVTLGTKNRPVSRNADSGDKAFAYGQNENLDEANLDRDKSINGTKWPYLKDFCIVLEKCAVPRNFLEGLECQRLEKRTVETELLKENHDLDDRSHKNNEREAEDSNLRKSKSRPTTWVLKNLIKEHNYCHTKKLIGKPRKRPNDKRQKQKIQMTNVDIKKCLKKLEIVIPKIDPTLIKYNIVMPEHRQEILNEANEGSGAIAKDMSQVCALDNMPVLTKEVDMKIDSAKVISNKPPLLEPQVQVHSLPRKVKQAQIKSTGSKSMSCQIQKKASFEERIQTPKEVESSESMHLTKVNDNIHLNNRKDRCLNDKEEKKTKQKKLDNNPAFTVNECQQYMDFKSIIQSRWSELKKDNLNIISEILHTDSSNVDLSSFVNRRK